MVNGLASDPAVPGLIPSISEYFSEEKIAVVADVNLQCCFEGSRLWLKKC